MYDVLQVYDKSSIAKINGQLLNLDQRRIATCCGYNGNQDDAWTNGTLKILHAVGGQALNYNVYYIVVHSFEFYISSEEVATVCAAKVKIREQKPPFRQL